MTDTTQPPAETLARAKARAAKRAASGDVHIEGSIYEGMAACLTRHGATIAHVVKYEDAVEIAAALTRRAGGADNGLANLLKEALPCVDDIAFSDTGAASLASRIRSTLSTLPPSRAGGDAGVVGNVCPNCKGCTDRPGDNCGTCERWLAVDDATPAGKVTQLIQWARDQMALPDGSSWMGGHIDEKHRYKLRDLVDAIDATTPKPPAVGETIGQSDGDPDGWLAVKVNTEGGIVMPYGPLHAGPDRPNDARYRWAPFYLGEPK